MRTNPSDDAAFRAAVERCLAGGVDSPTDLCRCLRDDYPNAAVTDGIIERGAERWYAYREGHWVRSADSG